MLCLLSRAAFGLVTAHRR